MIGVKLTNDFLSAKPRERHAVASLASEAGGEAPTPARLAQAAPAAQAESDQQRKSAFLKSTRPTNLHPSQGIQEAASPYRLMAGTVIPAALVTGINSDLPEPPKDR